MTQRRQSKTKFALIDNLRIRYQDNAVTGTKTLIFLHGLGGSLESWKNNLGPLSRKYRTLAFDLPGFGLSDKPHRKYTLKFFSSFVLNAVRELDVGLPFNILGSSLGGQIAANISSTNPNVLDKLILISPAGFTPRSFSSSPGLLQFAGVVNAISRMETKKALSATTTVQVTGKYAKMIYERMQLPGAKEAFISTLKNSTIAKRINLNNIKTETLVIWGKNDQVIPVGFVQPFIEMKNCRLYILENCGHRPHAEKPSLVNEAIKRFIDNH